MLALRGAVMRVLIVALAIAAGYLLGSLSGSLLLGRARGVDIRGQGSGNAGGTNALRTQGWRFALGVVAIDAGKGALAAWLGLVAAEIASPALPAQAIGAAAAFAAIVGHCWPLYFGFRGGKGAGTTAGAFVVLAPIVVPPLLATWALVLVATGYVGLATVLAAIALVPLAAWLAPAFLVFAIAVALLVVFTHRGNLARLWRGEEYRFDKARVLPRLFAGSARRAPDARRSP